MVRPGVVFPWDGRDQEDLAEIQANTPLRTQNKRLEEENMRLKRLLRENGISWSPSIVFPANPAMFSNSSTNSQDGRGKRGKRYYIQTRSLAAAVNVQQPKVPHLPMEVLLRILQYAMTSGHPIIDPLSKVTPEHQTLDENHRQNQVAIHALAACRAFHVEGTRYLWTKNKFLFTSPQALRNFACLPLTTRSQIKHVTLRIIAKFYDDQKRTHLMNRAYHPELKRDVNLRVVQRLKENPTARKGFRCYAWCQTVDFLDALRPPFDPTHNKKEPRPRLLPALESMRIDFVNFPEYFLPPSDTELHEMAAHDLGCTLNELIVTGLPCCDVGMKAGNELSGMVRDDGLFMDCAAAFVQMKSSLRELGGRGFACKIMRPWRRLMKEHPGEIDNPPHAHDHHPPETPPVPEEEGHPTVPHKKRKVMWKRVPITRDSEEREWIEFDRKNGLPVDELKEMLGDDSSDFSADDESYICAKCGEVHEGLDTDFF